MDTVKKCISKPYLYDLYRWTGKVDLLTFFKWLLVPKYRIVFLKRKCELYRGKNKLIFILYRIVYEHYMIKYGVDIGSKTEIGSGFIIRHIGGIAINNEVKIGNNVEILQGVTIGYERRGNRKGNPTIGNNVWIGSNSIIVGNITLGNNVLVAPGTFINFDVPDNSIVIGNPGRVIRKKNAVENYVINVLEFN